MTVDASLSNGRHIRKQEEERGIERKRKKERRRRRREENESHEASGKEKNLLPVLHLISVTL